MKIYSHTQTNNFNGIPVIKTVLQKQVCKNTFRPIDAFVYFMEKADLTRAGMDNPAWGESKYGANILYDAAEKLGNPFKKTSERFLFIEVPQEMDYCKVKALSSIFVDAQQVRGGSLQSLRPHECLEPIKGAGLMVLYTMTKIAEKLKKAQVYLTSRANDDTVNFYRRSGMIEGKNNAFMLPSDMFRTFQQKIEERFPVLKIFEENIN